MNNTKNSLSSLALDLNRVALGLHRGSKLMAERFFQEALARKTEINTYEVPVYISKILAKINRNNKLDEKFAEDALVYSTLIENFVIQKL